MQGGKRRATNGSGFPHLGYSLALWPRVESRGGHGCLGGTLEAGESGVEVVLVVGVVVKTQVILNSLVIKLVLLIVRDLHTFQHFQLPSKTDGSGIIRSV